MSDQKLLHPKNVVKTAQNRCQSLPHPKKTTGMELNFIIYIIVRLTIMYIYKSRKMIHKLLLRL